MAKPWAKTEIDFINHPKFRALSANAICLWIEGKNYCDKHMTDGLIPAHEVKQFRFRGTASIAALLLSAGPKNGTETYQPLWATHEIGFKMVGYLEYNPCREEALARIEDADDAAQIRRLANKKRQTEFRAKRKAELAALKADVEKALVTPVTTRFVTPPVTVTCATPSVPVTVTSTRKDSSEPDGSEPPVLVFPVVGNPKQPTWGLQQSRIDVWQEAYPHVDVLAECRKARVWTQDNPAKRKQARGMPAFLSRWIGKAVDRGHAAARTTAPPVVRTTPTPAVAALLRERGAV